MAEILAAKNGVRLASEMSVAVAKRREMTLRSARIPSR